MLPPRWRMCMPTTCCIGLPVAAMRSCTQIVKMVRNRWYVCIGMRIEVLTRLAAITRLINDVVQVRNHAGRSKSFSVLIEVHTPGIASSMGKHIKLMLQRMVSPDPSVNLGSFRVWCTRFSNIGMREYTVASIQPTVRSQ